MNTILNPHIRTMLKIRLGDELLKCKMVFTGDNYINTYNYKSGFLLKCHRNFNKKVYHCLKLYVLKKSIERILL